MGNSRNPSNQQKSSLREFMKTRHPDLFSDTLIDDTCRLPKEVLEYYLDTLTNRKQEYQFEHFCRKLAEKEICPNLRPQVGPTGGGDGGVDSENYPVAKEISERWWVGSPSAGTEQWAFAFSAKKDWKQKIKADVGKILDKKRDYKIIYFITNQFVKDKDRSSQEASLTESTGVRVCIIDRGWIVAKVYESNHLDIVVSALGLDDIHIEKKCRPGPRDAARLQELEELDRQINDSSRYQSARYQLIEDCLHSAILARGLGRSQIEVEQRFERADRLAKDLDLRQQRLRVAYNRAWTAYWWYEDFVTFRKFYDEVEKHAKNSSDAQEVEFLLNLWFLLHPLIDEKRISPDEANLESRTKCLITIFETIENHEGRPNNAQQARTCLALMKIHQAHRTHNPNQVEIGFIELSKIVNECATLPDYPVEKLFSLVSEVGNYVDSPALDTLHTNLIDILRQRRSEGTAGKAYVCRAMQKLQKGKPYEAIQWYGQAEKLLIKDEYRAELIEALLGSSHAYESVGLLWAARNKILASIDRAFAAFSEGEQAIALVLAGFMRLTWTELQLGRIPQILSSIKSSDSLFLCLELSEKQKNAYYAERQQQDIVLGIHFLNSPFKTLPNLTLLPDTLEELNLDYARMALLFVLGHEQVLRDEEYIPASEDQSAVQTFFEQWQDQPVARDFPSQPILSDGSTSHLRSIILGTQLAVETPNNIESLGIAESLLSVLEAFLATSNEEEALPYREHITIIIATSNQLNGTAQLNFSNNGYSTLKIEHSEDLHLSTKGEQRDYMESLRTILVNITSQMLHVANLPAWSERITGQEHALSRALIFGDVLTLNRNVFGAKPLFYLANWVKTDNQDYAVSREKAWREEACRSASSPTQFPRFGDGPPPKELTNSAQLKHTDRRVLSPIDIPLWNQAEWQGTVFGLYPNKLPILGIMFKDAQAGQKIFHGWKEKWGEEDKENMIRLAIITKLSEKRPTDYAVILGANPNMLISNKKVQMLVSRVNRMKSNNLTNLNSFLSDYRKAGFFLLAPAQMGEKEPSLFMRLAIKKRQLNVREAWQIGENDPDVCALKISDKPIVPPEVDDPPIRAALTQMRSWEKT